MSTARNSAAQNGTAQTAQPSLIESLQNRIRKLETVSRPDDTKRVSTGCPELDQLLPNRGLATGTITEWLTPACGYGAELLSLLAARQACADGGALVVIDPEYRFFPAAAAAWGINLENVIVLRKRWETGKATSSSLLWAIDQSLRCPAVAAVWGRLGHVHERWLRRFQLSAEQSGAMGMFVRPLSVKEQPGWCEVQWEVGKQPRISNLKSQIREVGKQPRISNLKSQILPSKFRPPTSHSPQPQPPMTEPMRRAYQRALEQPGQSNGGAAFDRTVQLRLLRVHGGQAGIDANKTIELKIDFTTGTLTAPSANPSARSKFSSPAVRRPVAKTFQVPASA